MISESTVARCANGEDTLTDPSTLPSRIPTNNDQLSKHFHFLPIRMSQRTRIEAMVGRFWRKQMEIFVLSTTNEGASRVGFLFWQADAPCSNWLFIAYIDRCVISANFGSEFCLRHGTARCAHLMVSIVPSGALLVALCRFLSCATT